uniref:site-specific DNA-methyltransferase (adenine-specific) n=1 Tax=viral metagenome TaxID=1070528 RepID=A0A6C0LA95_9ZZZZ
MSDSNDALGTVSTVSTVRDIIDDKLEAVKPIIKWVGGKTQIIDKVIANFPVEINNYREIFLGGGSVLLALLSYAKKDIIKIRGNIYAYDLNEPLINIYKNIQSKHNELYAALKNLIDDFSECGECININRKAVNIDEAKEAKENYYYWIRNKYNSLSDDEKNDVIGSAMLIFLNKTCFRGIFRVGPNGFNVPYGNYKNPEIINKNHLDIIHNLIKDVIFNCCDFRESMINIEDGDFLYLDPPYVPEKNTSFVGYTKGGFDIANHNELFAIIHTLKEKNIRMAMSNSDVEIIRNIFSANEYNYTIETLVCKRSINSKNPDSKTNEVIIRNY